MQLQKLTGLHDIPLIIQMAQEIAKASQIETIKVMAKTIKELGTELLNQQNQSAVLTAQLADCELSKAVLKEALDDAPGHYEPDEDDTLVTAVA